jgi:TetR/AcrR family transcriptional regulator, transcriptional repressor of bet genes
MLVVQPIKRSVSHFSTKNNIIWLIDQIYGGGMSRKRNTEQRRAEIVNALLATMAEHGYEKATIQLIARQAGLTPGLLHYHFKTKAEILLELVKALSQLSQQRYADFAATAVTPDQKLNAYVQARLGKGEGAAPHAVAAWVIIGAEAVRQPEVKAVYQGAVKLEIALIEELLTACLRDKQKQLAQVKPLSAALLAFMEGAFQLASAAPDAMPAGFAADTATQLVRRFIDAEPDL